MEHSIFSTNYYPTRIGIPVNVEALVWELLVTINHDFALVSFGARLLMSPILKFVYKLHLLSTTFLLPLHIIAN